MYSKPRDFMTSSMKSEPGWSAVRTSVETGSVSAANALADGNAALPRAAWVCCAFTSGVFATRAAAPAAAPFRKPRRFKGLFFDFSMILSFRPVFSSVRLKCVPDSTAAQAVKAKHIGVSIFFRNIDTRT